VWTVVNGVCPSGADTVQVIVVSPPSVANAGPDMAVSGATATLSANNPSIGNGTWSVVSGSGNFVNSSSPATVVNELSIGDNVLGWTISNGVCPDSYDEVVIHVNDLVVPNGFSPNGDMVNDNFEVPGLSQFPNARLQIFNRWGNLVFESDDYRNDWGGKNSHGQELSDDTYYYTLEVTKEKTYKGFVVLKRE
jgi:gliding motility-associated-like protein